MALKALALDIGQIGELTEKLSEDTIDSFRSINVKLAYSIRNRIDHAYLSVKPQEIALTAMQLSGKASIDEIKTDCYIVYHAVNKDYNKPSTLRSLLLKGSWFFYY